jgi:hypothetical protein
MGAFIIYFREISCQQLSLIQHGTFYCLVQLCFYETDLIINDFFKASEKFSKYL